jgi:anti-sigma28 factor (negative regulator of flagellin synthesis)
MADIEFPVNADPEYTWAAWGDSAYKTVADIIGELIDNSIEAEATECRVRIDMEDGLRFLIVEDNGKWGTLDKETLSKCFGFGKKPGTLKTGLNEHNCGLKQVLATTDPDNANWVVQIKQKHKVREIRAPYTHYIKFRNAASYLGEMSHENSTVIKTVISDVQFKTLYKMGRKGTYDESILINRLRIYLAAMWMMNYKVISGEFSIYLDGVIIRPYTLHDKDGVRKMENAVTKPFPLKLSATTKPIMVEVWRYTLSLQFEADKKKKPHERHPLFRRNPDNAGVYIFKHGRLVKGAIFDDIFNILRDYAYGGYLLLVNITGDSVDLPSTQTTKNDFSNRDVKLTALYDEIKDKYYPVSEKVPDVQNRKEEELMSMLYMQKVANHKKSIERGEYHVEQEKILNLTADDKENISTGEEIDILEWNTKEKTVNIIEGKISAITSQNLRQLFFYYRNLKYFCAQFSNYTIVTQFITLNPKIEDSYKHELIMLQALDPDFNPEIEVFSDYGIGI